MASLGVCGAQVVELSCRHLIFIVDGVLRVFKEYFSGKGSFVRSSKFPGPSIIYSDIPI